GWFEYPDARRRSAAARPTHAKHHRQRFRRRGRAAADRSSRCGGTGRQNAWLNSLGSLLLRATNIGNPSPRMLAPSHDRNRPPGIPAPAQERRDVRQYTAATVRAFGAADRVSLSVPRAAGGISRASGSRHRQEPVGLLRVLVSFPGEPSGAEHPLSAML